MKILAVRNLKKYFPIRSGVFLQVTGWVRALQAVDLDIEQGVTVGIVGESGCGKSTLGRTIVKIYEPTAGSITYHDPDGMSRHHPGPPAQVKPPSAGTCRWSSRTLRLP